MKDNKRQSKKDFFVIRGKVAYGEVNVIKEVVLKSLGIKTSKEPLSYKGKLLKDIIIRGKTADGRSLFNLHPYKREDTEAVSYPDAPLVFVQAVPYPSELETVQVLIGGKILATMDRRNKAKIRINLKPSNDGITLDITGVYDNLQIKALDPDSDRWVHIFLDDETKSLTNKPVKIDWEQFPLTKTAVIEAIATKGLDAARYRSKAIRVRPKPPEMVIQCVGFEKFQDVKENPEDSDGEMFKIKGKTAKNRPEKKTKDIKETIYEFAFRAHGALHGESLPNQSFVWEALGRTIRNHYFVIQHKGKEPFIIRLSAIDQLNRKVTIEEEVNPLDFEKKYLKKVLKSVASST